MKIAIVGSGNVAAWLISSLSKTKYKVSGVYSRNRKTATLLAKKHSLEHYNSYNEVKADVVFICVNDDSIDAVAKNLKDNNATLIHTSGTVSIDVLHREKGGGVFWPLQTITSTNSTEIEVEVEVPIFISATDEKTEIVLKKIAKAISPKVYSVNDGQRKNLHLSAVMTNNFINHLVLESKSFLEKNGLKYEMLLPILKQTFSKLTDKPYNFTQTGPATRGDKKTISSHKNLLKESSPELLKMYTVITESIIKKYNP